MLYSVLLESYWDQALDYSVAGDYGGWFHVYAFTMTMGVLFTMGISAYKLWKRKVGITELLIAAVFVVPFALLGASFFGKLNGYGQGINASEVPFWGLFAFWEAGMAIHGGVYAGTLVGMLVFYIMSRKTKVSLWVYADCIIPNVLIGQSIGRWGNFFNHELMGKPIGLASENHLSWLPKWLTSNTQLIFNGPSGNYDGVGFEFGERYQMEPIFFYESIGLFLAWLLITFIIPGFGKWISKKPWKLHPESFNLDMKYSFRNFFTKKTETNKQTYKEIWNEAFYENISKESLSNYEKYLEKREKKNILKDRWEKGRMLVKANNPDGYLVTKSGAEAGAYFFLWNLVRFALETRRDGNDLFIKYDKPLSLSIIALTGFIGLIIMILTQNVFAYMFRKPGITYEKDYFFIKEITNSNKKTGIKKIKPNAEQKYLLKEAKAKAKFEKLNK